MFGKSVEKTITVEGMHCMHCAKSVENAIKALDGVKSVKVDLESKSVKIVSKAALDDEAISAAVKEAGFEVVA